MSRTEKLLIKLQNARNTFPWKDLVVLLTQLGYEKQEMSGSRVRFYNAEIDSMMLLHKPHPKNDHLEDEMSGGALKSVKLSLEQENLL